MGKANCFYDEIKLIVINEIKVNLIFTDFLSST